MRKLYQNDKDMPLSFALEFSNQLKNMRNVIF